MSFISGMLGGQAATPQTLKYTGETEANPAANPFAGSAASGLFGGALSGMGGGPSAEQLQFNQQVNNQNALRGRMQGFEGQLQNQAQGGGPSVSTTMLKNAQQQNAANANGLAASQRGVNPGMALRQALQSNAGANQQAQATGVAARQQEQLNAQSMLGQNQGQQAGLLNAQVGQGLQASLGQGQIAAQTANANAGRAQSAAGGLAGGLAGAFGLAEGGEVPNIPAFVLNNNPEDSANPFALKGEKKTKSNALQPAPQSGVRPIISTGGMTSNVAGPMTQQQAGPQSFIGKALSNVASIPGKILGGVENTVQGFGNEVNRTGQDLKSMFAGSPQSRPDAQSMVYAHPGQGPINGQSGDLVIAKANGGLVPAMVSPGERYLPPSEVKKVEKGEKSPMKAGEKIPGKPKVGGATNSYSNDTVHKKLKEGGIVLPRTVTMSPDAEKKAMAFMKALQAKRGNKA